jgi:short-subunit dehydrogenase
MRTGTKIIVGGLAAGAALATVAAGMTTAFVARLALKRLRRRTASLIFPRSSRRPEADLRGQTVLITGSSRGLGLALAEEFARERCKLVLCSRKEHALSRARQRIERLGAEVCAVPCDVSRPEQVEHLIRVAHQQFGKINILVNNAGIISVAPLLSQSRDDFREAMDIIFWGMVHPTLAVLPEMIDRREGRIVNITSVGGRVSVPHLLPYNCAKFASVGFSEGLHAEVKRFGIDVLTVVPGLMRTGSHVNARFKGNHAAEYRWFSAGATSPLLSMSAQRAAESIVEAMRTGRPELTLGWQARALTGVHQISPGLVADALALINRVLPKATSDVLASKTGREIESSLKPSRLPRLGRRAAQRYNQLEEAA